MSTPQDTDLTERLKRLAMLTQPREERKSLTMIAAPADFTDDAVMEFFEGIMAQVQAFLESRTESGAYDLDLIEGTFGEPLNGDNIDGRGSGEPRL